MEILRADSMPPRTASPAPVRKSPRKSMKSPARLGIDDNWGAGPASKYTSDLTETAKKTNADEIKEDANKKGAPIVGVADVLTMLFGFGLFAYGLKTKDLLSVDKLKPTMLLSVDKLSPTTIAGLVGTAFMISGSHILYALIWYYPKKFMALVKKAPLKFFGVHAVAVFGKLVLLWKMLQQVALLAFVSKASLHTLKALVMANTPEQWAIAAALFFAGQVLNVAIYRAIGNDGVYYGFKLGRKVPWSFAFPFNAGYRHPQYAGAVLSQLGVLLIVTNPETLASGLCVLLAWWVLMYLITSYVEAKGDNDK